LNQQDERVAILVSSPTKLLGIPSVKSSSGLDQKNAVVSLLEQWGLTDSVLGLCFDTTASNSGAHQGACTLIEKHLNRPLFWLPCRRHVAEHVKHAAKAVIGQTKGPSDGLLHRFKESFHYLTLDKVNPWKWPKERSSFLAQQATVAKIWAEDALVRNVFPRADYRELCELIVAFLGGYIPNGLTFKKPGADHHARFMSKSIYYLKIFLLSKTFKMSAEEKKTVKRMAIFIGVFYGKYFLETSLSPCAPANDLRFYYQMREFKTLDSEVAEAVLKSMDRHLDYLTEELAIFSIFDMNLSEEDRSVIGKTLSEIQRPTSFPMGKRNLPSEKLTKEKPHLSSFLGPRSWFLFDKLNLKENQEWLSIPAKYWDGLSGYKIAKYFVENLLTVTIPPREELNSFLS
jgi:hypothetical protein